MKQLDRIEQKLDALLSILDSGRLDASYQADLLKDVRQRGMEAIRDHNRRIAEKRKGK
jgi:hypothetical protein